MKVLLFERESAGLLVFDVPGLDEVPKAVLLGDRVFVDPTVGTGDASDHLWYDEALVLRLELPAVAGL